MLDRRRASYNGMQGDKTELWGEKSLEIAEEMCTRKAVATIYAAKYCCDDVHVLFPSKFI